jgi:hypothetical protein
MEMTYSDYIKYMEEHLTEKETRQSAAKVMPFGKFRMSGGRWEPDYYPGFTLIAPVDKNDAGNVALYDVLVDAIGILTDCLDKSKALPAPATALHMTVARLVSDDIFKDRILNKCEKELLGAFIDVFRAYASYGPLTFVTTGILILPSGVIAASISPASEEDYRRLQQFRDHVYGDETLAGYGIERKRGFKGHITLFYIEGVLTPEEREELADCLTDLNRRYFSKPLPFTLTHAEVRQFESFLEFYRKDDWPVFRF